MKTTLERSSGSGAIITSEAKNNFSAHLSFKSVNAHKLSCDLDLTKQ